MDPFLVPFHSMFDYRFVTLLGPNRWAPVPMLEFHYPDVIAAAGVANIAVVAERLQQFLDSRSFTTTHPQSIANADALTDRLSNSCCHGEAMLALARWFSAMAGVPTRDFGIDREQRMDQNRLMSVVAMEMEEQELSQRCYELALEVLQHHEESREFPLSTKFRELFDYADDVRLGPSSRAILRAARRRDIPYTRLNRGSLVQLGEGKHQRRIWTAETDATSAIAEAIASDKHLTKRLLRQVGVPVPHGRQVTDAEDAWRAANEIGFPVVVKPVSANHQRGISIELYDREEILKAYEWAINDGQTNEVMVEQFAYGYHHRLLVVGDRMVAASRGHFDTVTGDGKQTVAELVDELNSDPRRGEAYNDPLGVVKLDGAARIELKKQNLNFDSVPKAGQLVLVSRVGDLTTDCTDEVHPQLVEQSILAARVVGLDIAGLDVLATDISKPLESQRGAVVEVNAGPSLSPHVSPLFGKPQKVGDAIVDMLFPNNAPSRIKIIGIVQSATSATLLDQLSAQLRLRNIDFGMASHGEAGFNGRIVDTGCEDDASRVAALLGNPILTAILIHLDLESCALFGACAPRLDRLIVPKDAIPKAVDPAMLLSELAGLRAVVHAVPPHGSIYCDALSTSIWEPLSRWKQPATRLVNSLEGAFEIEL